MTSENLDTLFFTPEQIANNLDKLDLGQQRGLDQGLPAVVTKLKNTNQVDYVNSHIAYLFFALQKQVDRYLYEETKLLKLEQEIAKATCPYKLGSTVWVSRPGLERVLYLVSQVIYTFEQPHYALKYRRVYSTQDYLVGPEEDISISLVTMARHEPIPEPFFSKLVGEGKISTKLNPKVGEYKRERELGEQLLATCPKGVDPIQWVNKVISMPRNNKKFS